MRAARNSEYKAYGVPKHLVIKTNHISEQRFKKNQTGKLWLMSWPPVSASEVLVRKLSHVYGPSKEMNSVLERVHPPT